jgi:hypothetical protein
MEERMDERTGTGPRSVVRISCLLACLALPGCGLVALPFRVAGDVVKVVPVVGKPLGEPIHAVGDAID